MPETEPTPWELMRLMRQVDAKLDQVVTKDMFQAESRRVDERLDEQGRDITDERVARQQAIADEKSARDQADADIRAAWQAAVAAEKAAREKAQIDAEAKQERLRVNVRWLAASILVPVTLFVIERFGGGA